MSRITTHVLDTASGRPAEGVPVVLERADPNRGGWEVVGRGTTDADGRQRALAPAGRRLAGGTYRLTFDTGAYFTRAGVRAFCPAVSVVFAIDDAHLRYELEASKSQLKKEFGLTVNFFCYPAGAYNQHVIDAVKRAGYLAATTTDEGFARPQDTFVLGRVRINGSDGPAGLLAKLRATDPNAAPTLRPQGGA